MILSLNPFVFLVCLFYMFILTLLLFISDFYYFWLLIEVLNLVYIGISYSIFKTDLSNLILYFLFQVICSFNLLVFFLVDYRSILIIFVLVKLAIFPFFSWYCNTLFSFPLFPLFLALTFNKIPVLILVTTFVSDFDFLLVLVCCIATQVYRGFLILQTIRLRILLIISSLANSRWLLLTLVSGRIFLFIVYILLYYSLLLWIFIKDFLSFNSLSILKKQQTSLEYFIIFSNLRGFPPLPLFFVKFFLVYNLISFYDSSIIYILIIILVVNILVIVSYIKLVSKNFINNYRLFFVF